MSRPGFAFGPDEGNALWSLGGRFTTKLAGTDADGHLAVIEAVAWRSAEPPLHVHHREHEAWYVVEGQLTFRVGDSELVAGAGTFAFAPKDVPHAFTVDVEPTRVLVLAAPAGFEGFVKEVGVPASGGSRPESLDIPAPEILGPIAERYGIEIVGPPLRIARGQVPEP
ncbi:MAG: cupin domain-containing protein [Candidatus Limnocylindria bacterium]